MFETPGNNEIYKSYSRSMIDGYDENYKYDIGDIVRVYGDMYEISGINRGDFVGKLIKKNRFPYKKQIFSVFVGEKRKEINKKEEEIKEMIELAKKLRKIYTNKRLGRMKIKDEIYKILPRYENTEELKKIEDKLKQLDKKFLENLNECCKNDDINSLKELESYYQSNNDYNDIIKDLEERLKGMKEEQARKAGGKNTKEQNTNGQNTKEQNTNDQNTKKQNTKEVYLYLVNKHHPDRTGVDIIKEILKRDLTNEEKGQIKNELDILCELNNEILQEINGDREKGYSLKKRENFHRLNVRYNNEILQEINGDREKGYSLKRQEDFYKLNERYNTAIDNLKKKLELLKKTH